MRSSGSIRVSRGTRLSADCESTWTPNERSETLEPMAAKKKSSEKRETHLGIRLTDAERKRLANVAKRFPIPESAVARIALLKGLEAIERDGINLPSK